MEGRQWSDGLHQAVEAKEGVPIKQETQTLRLRHSKIFLRVSEAFRDDRYSDDRSTGFMKIYKLDVVAIPTNRGLQRIEHPDLIYLTEKDKFKALAEEVERTHKWDVLKLKDDELWGIIESEDDEEVKIVLQGEKKSSSIPKSTILEIHRKGRPVLIGTVSIEKSERLASLLERRGIKHDVLNAKQHGREADIVAQAGRLDAVTIATNMAVAGRHHSQR